MNKLFLTTLLAASAFAADITFASGANCTGQPLYGGVGLEDTKCYDLSFHDGDVGESVLLSKLSSSEVVTFYRDSMCQKIVEKFSNDACFNPLDHLGSFQVTHTDISSKELVRTPIKLSDYRDLAVSSPYEIDLRYSNFYVGVAALSVAGGLQLYAAAVACTSIHGPDPVGITACIAVPLATVIAVVGHLYLKKAGQNAESAIEMRTGHIGRRSWSTNDISDLNTRYMATLMARSEVDTGLYTGEHVGFVTREGEGSGHTSPIYEVDMGTGGKWHLAAFYNSDSGAFVHHMRSAVDTQLTKRSPPYGYDTVRWGSGGLDFHFCPYGNGKSADGYSGQSLNSLYDVVYDQLTCYLDENQLKTSTSILVDMYNEEGNLKGSIDIVPYAGNNMVASPQCSTTTASLNQQCQVD
jgi:hypothetical protein